MGGDHGLKQQCRRTNPSHITQNPMCPTFRRYLKQSCWTQFVVCTMTDSDRMADSFASVLEGMQQVLTRCRRMAILDDCAWLVKQAARFASKRVWTESGQQFWWDAHV